MTDRMTIGDVARRTGVSIKALRFYDELGILEVDGRSKSNYRVFTEAVLRCVADIRRFQEAGLTLRQVQELVRRARGGEDPELLLHLASGIGEEEPLRPLPTLAIRGRVLGVSAALPNSFGIIEA